jgi:hypothetical protein
MEVPPLSNITRVVSPRIMAGASLHELLASNLLSAACYIMNLTNPSKLTLSFSQLPRFPISIHPYLKAPLSQFTPILRHPYLDSPLC